MSGRSYLLAEDPTEDLIITEAMVAELEDYIVNDELYRTLIVRMSSGDRNVRMTGADLLARLHRLNGEREMLTEAEQVRLDSVQEQASATIYAFRTRFHERLERDVKGRLDSLRWFLDECDEDRQRCRTEFPYEMRNRQRIEEVLKQLDGQLPTDLNDKLIQIDQRIRQHTKGTGFIWDPRLERVYPPSPYWYLYVRP